MDVLVAGGAHSLVFGNFQRNLNNFGINIVSHTSVECKSYTGIPIGAEGVIVLKDMINHELSGKVVADAKVRGIPHALVERKWAKAQDILVKTGFIHAPATNTPIKAMDTKPVVDFIVDIRTRSNRTAPLAEVRKRFPLITGDEYNVACGIASKHSNITIMSDKEIATHIGMVLAEDYGLIKDGNALFTKTKAMFPEIATFVTPPRVQAVIQDTLDLWNRDSQAQKQAIYAWAVTRYRQFQKDGTGWVAFADLAKVVKPIFGIGGKWESFCDARAEVFGPWALRTLHLIEALDEFNKLHPEWQPITVPTARAEIDAGRMKGFKSGYLYRTSVEALEEYVATHSDSVKPVVPVASKPIKELDLRQREDVIKRLGDKGLTREQAEDKIRAYEAQKNGTTPIVEPTKPTPVIPVTTEEVGSKTIPSGVDIVKNPKDPPSTITFQPNPAIDTVGLADLIESGIKIHLDQFMSKLDARVAVIEADQVEAIAAVKHDVETLVNGVTTTIGLLSDAVKKLGDLVIQTNAEVKSLREQLEATKSDPDTIKAQNLGFTLLNAKGAEVRLTIGDFKG